MSIRHAANRFLNSPILGWDGAVWEDTGVKGALLGSGRPLANTDSAHKFRGLLTSADAPLPSSLLAIKVGSDSTVYLLGDRKRDVREVPYSEGVLLRKALFLIELFTNAPTLSASGVKAKVTPTSKGTFFCDLEPASIAQSSAPTIGFSMENIILPTLVTVDTSYIGTVITPTSTLSYEIQEVYQASGFLYCRAISTRKAK